MFSFANKKTDLTSDNLGKLSYQSIQTPVVGAEKKSHRVNAFAHTTCFKSLIYMKAKLQLLKQLDQPS